MTERPTPETDEIHRLNCLPSTPEEVAYRYVLNLSRRLERERDEARDDTRDLLREIFNLTQIGKTHPEDLPMKALQAIAEMIDEQWKGQSK